nr:unnamed protein product [Digitaria exilis]
MVFPTTTFLAGISSNTFLASAARPMFAPAFPRNPCTWSPSTTAPRSAEQHLTTELAVKAFGRGPPLRRSMSRNSAIASAAAAAAGGEEHDEACLA